MDRLDRFLRIPGEEDKVYLKKRFFFISCVSSLVISFATAAGSTWTKGIRASNASLILSSLLGVFAACFVAMTKRSPRWLIRSSLLLYVIPIALMDLHLASSLFGYRAWPLLLIVLDVGLVLQEVGVSRLLIVVVSLWLLLMGLEQTLRFGLFDIFDSQPETACQCDHLPCARGISTGFTQSAASFLVLYLNFYLTHGFSKALWKGQREIEVAIAMAEHIAVALANFDLITASSSLATEEAAALPPPLTRAFHSLVSNLQEYRPYLPQSCLPLETCDDESSEENESPSTPSIRQPESRLSNQNKVDRVTVSSRSRRESLQMAANSLLVRRRVSILVTNVHKFLNSTEEVIAELQAQLVSAVVGAVRGRMGIIHWFNGDHVTAVFNGAKHCLSHAKNAAFCADDLSALWDSPPLTIAVVSGKAMCGNIGCHDVKAYGIIGHVFCWAATLVRFATQHDIPIACDTVIERDTGGSFYFRLLLHGILYVRANEQFDVFELTGIATTQRVDEWMYEMQQSMEGNPWLVYNKAVAVARSGDIPAARNLLAEHQPPRWRELDEALSRVGSARVLPLFLDDCHLGVSPPEPFRMG